MSYQLFVPSFRTEECLEEIRQCLDRGWTGLGYKTAEFEEAWKAYTGLPYAHFMNSATAGLHLAVRIFGEMDEWEEGDEVISTPITFVSTNHAIAYEGYKVVFGDVDEYLCLDPKDVLKKITPKTKAVIFVGYGGSCGRFEEVAKICREKGLRLILDAAHMSGTTYKGDIVGREADAIIYSYQAVKNLPTADSGMICFKEKALDILVRKYTWLGINKDTYTRTNTEGNYKWKYDVEVLGYKYHGNSVIASIGLVQLKYLEEDNEYRRQVAKWYDKALESIDEVKVIPVPKGCKSSRHLYVIDVDRRDDLIQKLNEKGVYPGVHYLDNTEYEMYRYAKGTCPMAHFMTNRIISLPLHLKLVKKDVEDIVDILKECINEV